MAEPGTYTIVDKIPTTWIAEKCTGQVRFISRQTGLVLQQQWEINSHDGPKLVDRRWEWRDVPIVDEAPDSADRTNAGTDETGA